MKRKQIILVFLGVTSFCFNACHKNDPICYQCNAPLVRTYWTKGGDTIIQDGLILYTGVHADTTYDTLVQAGYARITDTLYNAKIPYTDCFNQSLNNDIMKFASGYFQSYCQKK